MNNDEWDVTDDARYLLLWRELGEIGKCIAGFTHNRLGPTGDDSFFDYSLAALSYMRAMCEIVLPLQSDEGLTEKEVLDSVWDKAISCLEESNPINICMYALAYEGNDLLYPFRKNCMHREGWSGIYMTQQQALEYFKSHDGQMNWEDHN